MFHSLVFSVDVVVEDNGVCEVLVVLQNVGEAQLDSALVFGDRTVGERPVI